MPIKRPSFHTPKYIAAFLISVVIFIFGFLISDYFNNRRFSEINRAKQDFQVQVLSLETQLSYFKDILCADINEDILTHELHLIGEKLQFMENDLGKNHPEVKHLKQYYTLLQIRHYQSSQRLNERCNLNLVHILYFYADRRACPDCQKQGEVLSYLRQKYPLLRIYSFDYQLDLPSLAIVRPRGLTMPQDNYLPIIVIENQSLYGFKTIEEIEKILSDKNIKPAVES